MEKVFWAVRYFFLLVRKSILIPILVGIQFVTLFFAPQGRDVLKALSSENNLGFQLITFEFSIILSGILYFLGAYWLLFFSGTKGNLFEDPEHYPTSRLKIKAWLYHEFIQKYRGYLLRLYTGLLLFGPFFILLLSYSFVGFSSIKWFLACVFTLIVNCIVLYLRNNRNTFWVVALRVLTSGIAKSSESIFYGFTNKLKSIILPIGDNSPIIPEKINELPISIDFKGKSLLQTFSAFRGGFYLLLYFGFILVCFLLGSHRSVLETLGPATVIQLGLCFWSIVLIWIAYLNKVFVFPFYGALLIFFVINSFFNVDHPILQMQNENLIQKSELVNFEKAMEKWLQSRPLSSIKEDSLLINSSVFTEDNPYKYLIINAEGGANRSGYWTAMVLDSLRKKLGPKFDEQIFAFASVSGGSMGVLSYSAARETNNEPSVSHCLQDFYKEDFLSALTNRLIVGEIFGAFIPFYSESLDRAVAFEKSVDEKIQSHILPEQYQNFSFNNLIFNPNDSGFNPIYLIHSTEVESGRKAILSNQNLDSGVFSNGISLSKQIPFDLSLGSAIHLGARFPVFSPSAALKNSEGQVLHYVDGGYYENGGYETSNELIAAIGKSKFGKLLQPVVISIENEQEENQAFKGAFFLNEIQSIIGTTSRIRSANLQTHKRKLNEYLRAQSGGKDSILEFNLNASNLDIPMNWYLTKTARSNIEIQVVHAFKNKASILNPDSFWYSKKEFRIKEKPSALVSDSIIPIVKMKPELLPAKNPFIESSLQNPSPARNPELYYFSKTKKQWRLKSDADFNIGKLQPLKRKKIRYRKEK